MDENVGGYRTSIEEVKTRAKVIGEVVSSVGAYWILTGRPGFCGEWRFLLTAVGLNVAKALAMDELDGSVDWVVVVHCNGILVATEVDGVVDL